MSSPYLGTGANRQQRDYLVGDSTCDDEHTGAAIGDDLLQEFGHSRVRESLLAIEAEWRESIVIVEQKRGDRRPCHGVHELIENDWINRADDHMLLISRQQHSPGVYPCSRRTRPCAAHRVPR